MISASAIRGLRGREELARLRRGIEKESLRVTPRGTLAATPHPPALGSTLTHPHITTDFSEAQPELITGVYESAAACIAELEDIHRFVYHHLGDESLWAASMPCALTADEDIPLGRYGESHIGRMKTIYRRGLGHRYGRVMQTISGIHYNFSVPESLWPVIARARSETADADTPTRAYFDLIRNFRRDSWLLIYLFGASPAVCASFVRGRPHGLQRLDESTFYQPHATSLRMGPLGYQSSAQSSLHVSYNSLADYSETMWQALTTPFPPFEAIGLRDADGDYRQLGTALLQIENEFYGPIRPKRRTRTGEQPLAALNERGVEYVEVRCLDLDPFLPAGIDAATSRFLDAFLLACLLRDSPPDSPEESLRIQANQRDVVGRGRDPDLLLDDGGGSVSCRAWASRTLDECAAVSNLIDEVTGSDEAGAAVDAQRQKVASPELTPSARVLESLREANTSYFRFALNQSAAHKAYFRESSLPEERMAFFDRLSRESTAEQAHREAGEHETFDEYFARARKGYEQAPAPVARRA
ncbi:MAG: glutamate--cysteine ligase [Gammaproteobacteria bacterium]|nr:glutamate--cysteine ligase [Gammaproteobacteria bacterium]